MNKLAPNTSSAVPLVPSAPLAPAPSTAPATSAVRFLSTADLVPPLPATAPPDGSSAGFFDSLRAVTPALIITGIAIGIASGIGTTVGSTIGSVITDRFKNRRSVAPQNRRRNP